jgi:hypothetical protein
MPAAVYGQPTFTAGVAQCDRTPGAVFCDIGGLVVDARDSLWVTDFGFSGSWNRASVFGKGNTTAATQYVGVCALQKYVGSVAVAAEGFFVQCSDRTVLQVLFYRFGSRQPSVTLGGSFTCDGAGLKGYSSSMHWDAPTSSLYVADVGGSRIVQFQPAESLPPPYIAPTSVFLAPPYYLVADSGNNRVMLYVSIGGRPTSAA